MKMKLGIGNLYITVICVCCVLKTSDGFFDPVTFTVFGVGGAVLGGLALMKCKFSECCDNSWIKLDIKRLESDLKTQLHGQHIVEDTVLKVLRKHFTGNRNPSKPLVMSFHGFTGTGKNHVSRLIVKNLFVMRSLSRFVKTIVAPVHYPAHGNIESDKRKLISSIFEQVKLCKRSVIIFDEVDKMPPGLMDVVKPFLDYNAYIDGVDFTQATFIFLSNTGGTAIAKKTLEYWQEGKKREDITLHDMEPLIHQGAFNEAGGLSRSETISKNVVDYYIPFLPLERQHIKLCAKDEFEDEGEETNEEMLTWVADKMEYTPKDSLVYSTSGCKRVAQKVALWLETYWVPTKYG